MNKKAMFQAGASMLSEHKHFAIAAVLMLAGAWWWLFAQNSLKMVLVKEPVEWPKNIRVDEGFRLLTLPKKLGAYELVQTDENGDGREDGEFIHDQDTMDLLGIGTGYDKTRYASRCSNWYISRTYQDTRRAKLNEPFTLWQLDVTYYTGGLDTVPHVPERCLFAGGATLLGTEEAVFRIPAAVKPWDAPIKFKRTMFQQPDKYGLGGVKFVQYYVFSLNGRPEDSWEMVRAKLMIPWVRYSYFAKIQIAPQTPVADAAEADRYAEDFLNNILPSVLQSLPMPDDIDKLKTGKQSM